MFEVSICFVFYIKYMYKISQPIFLSLFTKYRSFKMYICKTFVRDACVCYWMTTTVKRFEVFFYLLFDRLYKGNSMSVALKTGVLDTLHFSFIHWSFLPCRGRPGQVDFHFHSQFKRSRGAFELGIETQMEISGVNPRTTRSRRELCWRQPWCLFGARICPSNCRNIDR